MIELVRRSIRIQTNLNEPDVEPFHELNSLSLVRLLKSSTFVLGLSDTPSAWVLGSLALVARI